MKKNTIAILLAIFTGISASAQDWAVTRTSANYLRNDPSYESALETQTLMGSVLQVNAREGRWINVTAKSPAYQDCWTNDMTLAYMDYDKLQGYLAADKFIVTAEYSHVYDSPVAGNIICDLVMGDLVRKVFNEKGKLVHTVTHAKVRLPDDRVGYVKYGDLNEFGLWLERRSADGREIVTTARKFTGTPYLWGGNSIKGVDCSGLVWMSYYMSGILLPRNASEMACVGVDVPLQALMAGDLLFYGNEDGAVTHVALYTGDAGIIHSSQIVYEASISPDSPNYFDRQIIGARRVLGHLEDGTIKAELVKDSRWYFPSAKDKTL